MPRCRLLLVMGLVTALSGCLHRRSDVPSEGMPVGVDVTNNYTQPMEVYVVGAGTVFRIGTVHPGMVGRFEVPRSMVGKGMLEIQAHPNVDQSHLARSGELLLAPGQVVSFVINAPLFNSTATVRP